MKTHLYFDSKTHQPWSAFLALLDINIYILSSNRLGRSRILTTGIRMS